MPQHGGRYRRRMPAAGALGPADEHGQRLVAGVGVGQARGISGAQGRERALPEQLAHFFPTWLLVPGPRQTHTTPSDLYDNR